MVSHANADVDRDVRGVMDSIRRIVQALRLYDRQAEKRVGLSGAELFVLQKLDVETGTSVNELARRTHTHQSSVSVVTRKLVDKKLVRRMRSKADGRAVELSLTPRGRRILRGTPEAAQDRLLAAVHQLAAPRRRQLKSLLEELVKNTGGGSHPPALFFEERRGGEEGKSRERSTSPAGAGRDNRCAAGRAVAGAGAGGGPCAAAGVADGRTRGLHFVSELPSGDGGGGDRQGTHVFDCNHHRLRFLREILDRAPRWRRIIWGGGSLESAWPEASSSA